MNPAAFIAGLASVAISAVAGAQAVDFRGVPLGASTNEFLAANPSFGCAPVTYLALKAMADVTCSPDMARSIAGTFDFGGAEADEISALFIGDRFGQLNVSFESRSFDDVLASLQAKYGKPTKIGRSPYRTQGGASAMNTEVTWRVGNATVVAAQFGHRIDRGYASYSADWMLEAQRARRQDAAQKGTKSL